MHDRLKLRIATIDNKIECYLSGSDRADGQQAALYAMTLGLCPLRARGLQRISVSASGTRRRVRFLCKATLSLFLSEYARRDTVKGYRLCITQFASSFLEPLREVLSCTVPGGR